jgi:hypothetical protein
VGYMAEDACERPTDEPTGNNLFQRGDVFANMWRSLTVIRDGTGTDGQVLVETDIGTFERVPPRELIELGAEETEGDR